MKRLPEKKLGASLDSDRKIAAYRAAVDSLHQKGGMTDEEHKVAHGNLNEAAAKLRGRLHDN